MLFEIVGEISEIQTIAKGRSVRRRNFLRKRIGGRRWRKQKGIGFLAPFPYFAAVDPKNGRPIIKMEDEEARSNSVLAR